MGRPVTRTSPQPTLGCPTAHSLTALWAWSSCSLGVLYWKLDADKSENDPELEKIRKARNYSWMDITTICKDPLLNYEEKVKMLSEEHLHLDEEIRYILEGSGYFDVGDKEDKWNQISMEKGDMITFPAGIYHRFSLDEKNYVKAMCLLCGHHTTGQLTDLMPGYST